MNARLFFRCSGGHYFQGNSCPFDGWTHDGIGPALQRFLELASADIPQGFDLIEELAPISDLRRRMLIVEFGDNEAEFQALAPDRYIYQGQELLWRDTGESLN